MPKYSNKKAVTDSQKKERFSKIIKSSKELFRSKDFKNITISEIAAYSGLAKGTLFLYFSSKEEIFLALAEQLLESWFTKLEILLDKHALNTREVTIESFVEIIINSVSDSIILKLFSILDDTIEQNIESERALEFKLFLKSNIYKIGGKIEALFPVIKSGEGITIINAINICLIGAYKVSNPSDIISEIVTQPGMEIFNRNFKPLFSNLMNYYLRGFLNK